MAQNSKSNNETERIKPSAELLREIGFTGLKEIARNLQAPPTLPIDIQITMYEQKKIIKRATDLLTTLNEIRKLHTLSVQDKEASFYFIKKKDFKNRILPWILNFGIISETTNLFCQVCNYFQN